MIFGKWLSIINYLESARTIMTLVGISLLLCAASLLLLVISYMKLKFKLDAKEPQTPPKSDITL